MRPLAQAFAGAMYGPIGFSILIGELDTAFRPYPDDMMMWLLYSIPAGAIFGSITGCVFGLAAEQKFKAAGWVSAIAAVGLGLLHIMGMWPEHSTTAHALHAIALNGPGFLWSAGFFVLSVKWFHKRQ